MLKRDIDIKGGLFHNDMNLKKTDGFTLLELVITVSLLGVVALIVAGALRIGVRAWEKGSQKVAGIQSSRVVLDVLKHQLSSALPHKITKEGETGFLFTGNSKQLQFVSISSLLQQQSAGIFLVTYRVTEGPDGETVSIREENLARIDWADRSPFEVMEGGRTLVEGAGKFSFEYAGYPEQDAEMTWEEVWDSRERGLLPVAVKLKFDTGLDPIPFEMVVRLPVENLWATIAS